MSEFDLKNNYLIPDGYPIDLVFFQENIYKLITIFGSSEFLYNNFKNEYFFKMAKIFERSKASELIISLAIMSRILLDSSNIDNESCKKNLVGKIIINDETKALNFRESCNKIIHAKHINFDNDKAENIEDGFLRSAIYLYGDKNGNNWKAIINIVSFCKGAIDSY